MKFLTSMQAYDFDLAQLATAILGGGDWRPRPDGWSERFVETGSG